MMQDLRRNLHRQQHGVAAVEFALIAPVLLLAIMGIFDLGYNMYVSSLLQGSIQKVARDSTIEGAASGQSDLDARVTSMVRNLAPKSTVTFNRTAYMNYSDVRRSEDFTDFDGDGTCNAGEPFEDANGNGAWDADRGSSGFGGARDAVLYEVSVTFTRPFPLWKLIGQSGTFTMVSRTVLRNQPYSLDAPANPIVYCA